MKKLLFGVMATVLFSFIGNAQKATNNEIRLEFAKNMVSFVESVKPAYSEKISFKTFKAKLLNDEIGLTVQGDKLLESAYIFLQNKTTSDEIIRVGNVKPLMEAFLFINDYNNRTKSAKGDLVLFGMNSDNDAVLKTPYKTCKWYQIFCHLSNAWNWLVENLGTIVLLGNSYCLFFPC